MYSKTILKWNDYIIKAEDNLGLESLDYIVKFNVMITSYDVISGTNILDQTLFSTVSISQSLMNIKGNSLLQLKNLFIDFDLMLVPKFSSHSIKIQA